MLTVVDRAAAPEGVAYGPKVLADRPSLLITEDGNVVTIELPTLVISIRQRASGAAYLESLKSV